MISWIVATNNLDVLYRNLIVSMWDLAGDELVVIEDAPSIANAYNQGQAKAVHPIRCYVHHDVAFLNLPLLREQLHTLVTPNVGLVGVTGSRTLVWPWWHGDTLGSVFDQRMGHLMLGSGGPCAVLDGVLLATRQMVDWDEDYPGWHGYDHDACAQMLAKGLTNWCLTDGHLMLRHNTTGSRDPTGTDWDPAEARFLMKWGGQDQLGRCLRDEV